MYRRSVLVSQNILNPIHGCQKLSKDGTHLTSDRDQNILTKLDTSTLIENNFHKISPELKLSGMIEIISKSQRNIFPVVDEENKLLGIITLDKIKEIIFRTDLYETVTAKELMTSRSLSLIYRNQWKMLCKSLMK